MKTAVRCRACGERSEVVRLATAPGDTRCVKCEAYVFRVSPTQLLMLERCPRSWYRKYVLGEEGPAPSVPMVRGSRFHSDVSRLIADRGSSVPSYGASYYVDQLPGSVRATEEKRQVVLPFGVVDLVIDVIDGEGVIREIKTGKPPASEPRPDHVFQVSVYAASEFWQKRSANDVRWSIDYVSLHTGFCTSYTGSFGPADLDGIEAEIEAGCRTARKYMGLERAEAWGILEGCGRCDWCRHL